MSYSTDIYGEILLDAKKWGVSTKSRLTRCKQLENGIAIVYAIATSGLSRELYIEIGEKPSSADFPHWNGIGIGIAKMLEYSNDEQYYFVMTQPPLSEGYIFEIVVEDLRTALNKLDSNKESLKCIESVLLKWKKFFLLDKDIKMTSERQQGLFGELLMLKELIEVFGTSSINHWAGSNDETHDFYIKSHAVEVKTTSVKAPYNIHISSEYQLDNHDVGGKLYLRFYAMRKSESDGMTLPELISQIEDLLSNTTTEKNQFHEKIEKYGYISAGAELYTTGFFVREEKSYLVAGDFPRLTCADIKKGIANITYLVNINMCQNYEISKELLFSKLKEVM